MKSQKGPKEKEKKLKIRENYGDTLLDHLLYHRGLRTKEEIEEFLNPNYEEGLHDPYLLRDMDKAVDRILKAIENSEKIVIYSDFDADGIPGAVAFAHFFKDIGYQNIEHYIPHRHDEGFGLHKDAIEKIKNAKADLLITIDCGISDVESAKYAKKIGLDLIVTDHHLVREKLPEAIAVIDPKRKDCEYPDKNLCGAGVAFKLIQGILAKNRFGLKEGREKWLLDMVGLATLSDMVPLVGENRIFAKYGLTVLKKSPRPGLSHLLSTLKVNQKNLTEDDVQFMITPRINVASRMGDPRDAFHLLSTTDFSEADRLVRMLNELNDERKGSVGVIVREINKKIKDRDLKMKNVIVLGNPDWRPALLGLVATNIVKEYNRPVFLWGRSTDENTLKGSCRSDGSVSLEDLMGGVVEGTFIEFGGHKMAGGFSVSNENVHNLEESLNKAYEKIKNKKRNSANEIEIDKKLSIQDIDWSTWNIIEKLSPFGEGNQKPTFLFEDERLDSIRLFGKAKEHLELLFLDKEGKKLSAISFFEKKMPALKSGDNISFIATLEKSVYRNYPELRLRIVDIL